MGILIKGMNMPTGCQCCFIERVGNRCLCGRHITTEEWNAMHRPDWCPLVFLPEKHGRLVDVGVLKSEIVKTLGISERKYLLPAEQAIWEIINKQKAVIEAEGE